VTTRVGILGFQGCIEPHERMLHRLGVEPVRVRTKEELASVDRLILPGGESTTMLRFLKLHDLIPALKLFGRSKPMWGICAGSILLAQEVHNPSQDSLQLINISAHRNFYGSQLDSFTTDIEVSGLHKAIPAQFIRAPLLNPLPASENRPQPSILARLNDQPVFFGQGHVWACSFHVELGEDPSLHELFLTL
jgi:5'-phosphate synthase pdxT subunit